MLKPRLLALAVRAVSAVGVFGTIAGVYAPDANAAEKVHVVAKGQTLTRIARRYRVSVGALRDANGLKPWEQIHPGLSLTIPGAGGTPEKAEKKAEKKTETVASRAGGKRGRERRAPVAEVEAPPEPKVLPASRTFRGPARRGFVRLVRGEDTIEVQLATRHGRITPNALASFSHMLRSSGGAKLAMDARLAALVGQVSEHFGRRPLHVVSGFRPYSPVQYTPHSNHNLGRAMDFSIEGVPNTTLRDYCRTFRDAGVGFYPNSTFVHLDVRTGKAYWIDYARPGEAPRYDSSTPRRAGSPAGDEPDPHTGVDEPADP